ncbi:MAG: AAA family ATPase [Desulfovibrionaceae bacterium]|nr:AAA family ATPase [Desulfovibrionaceae bacterium]
MDSFPVMKEPIGQCALGLLSEYSRKTCTRPAAVKKIAAFFGLDTKSVQICNYAFISNNFSKVQYYFNSSLNIDEYENQHLLALAMGMSANECAEYVSRLINMGIIDSSKCLTDSIQDVWRSGGRQDLEKIFCSELPESQISFAQCNVEAKVKEHVMKLLRLEDDEPKHIFLYGPPGTGKTTFVSCLAKELGVKVWSVVSQSDDNERDRRCSLLACVQMAQNSKGAFVLVDEAEKFLDTGGFEWGGLSQSSSKAWLTPFLEKKGIRIVWISNYVAHIDPAVRRRFTFSIFFPSLTAKDRRTLWRLTARRLSCSRKLTEKTIDRLTEEYPVEAAVIEKALRQTLSVAGPKDFVPTIERILEAHLTLENDGMKSPKKAYTPKDTFTLAGTRTDASLDSLLARLRKLDAKMRQGTQIQACLATLLFYGPPGTGKTELARSLAKTLGRPCQVHTASSLISCYVGETEQNIARAFAEAESDEAVLVFDEADSFLTSREDAQHSWERTQTNEFLTQLENCRTFCICTSNFREIIDSAAMRRFTFKIKFHYAGPTQIAALYKSILSPLAKGNIPNDLLYELQQEQMLTPGDFRAVYAQFCLEEGQVPHADLVKALKREEKLKLEKKERGIGFV